MHVPCESFQNHPNLRNGRKKALRTMYIVYLLLRVQDRNEILKLKSHY